jgi:predicted O-linked N-acetylglucosamine transferase (SPINDLY family)
LRIGYLSPDLCNHSVAHFIEPILAAHDRSGFEVFCYQLNAKSDEITARLKPLAEHWRDISALDDDAVAARIRADRIDILIDLAGNTDGNFAPVLIAKPAPVQITYLGYPTSLGIASVDYRLTDWQVDPEGYEAYSSERLLRMPSSYFCFHAREAPPLLPPPKARSGHIAFGSFNSLNKLSAATVQLWAAVLGAVPDATLFLKARALGDDATAQAVRQRFANAGVDPGRLRLAGWAADDTHLGLYADVDIALDTWPYNGATTTCQALWMGVPVVSLTGPTHAARMGLSILNAVGLSELVTANQDEYVKRCVELASAPARLQALRAGLRERMAASPLMDGVAFTVGLERLYRRAWAETAPGLAQAAGQVERSGVLA